ncbi:RNA 2'-phosphotransferase [Flavobacteriaceae bacterium R38]|nr:RNA 2'-phosphotransferase [Flavobacteriaceae bacterium R38]
MNNNIQTSKFLSLILRHQPEKIGLKLDENGWADVQELLNKMNKHHFSIDIAELKEVVINNDKQRFIFNDDETKIRANQGHSINVDLKYKPKQPPEFLYHGTVEKFIGSIKEKGLLKMQRHHVHLSEEKETAFKVGARRGKPIILIVKSEEMYKQGIPFFRSDNGVWLTDNVQSEFINFEE